jgi:hypothetical protein
MVAAAPWTFINAARKVKVDKQRNRVSKNPHDPQTGSVSSNGVGAWDQLDEHTFEYLNIGLFSDLSGNLTGFLKVRGTYRVSASGNEYTGTSVFELLGPKEEPLTPPITGTVSNKGEKISLEQPNAQP